MATLGALFFRKAPHPSTAPMKAESIIIDV
jgi:hypothetical protein